MARNVLSSLDGNSFYGELFWNRKKTKNRKCPVRRQQFIPPWKSSFPPDAPYLFFFRSGCHMTQVFMMPQIKKKEGSSCFLTAERSEFEAVVGQIEETKEAKRKHEISKVASTENFVLRGALLGWVKTEKIGKCPVFLRQQFIPPWQSPFLSNASHKLIIKLLRHYLERKDNEIAAERNPKRWKARSKGRRRKLKCWFLFVSKLRSTRSSWKGSPF